MCGLFGIVAKVGGNVSLESRMSRGLHGIMRRGPDGQGEMRDRYRGFEVAWVHTRLSIIDLSDTGRQPMHDAASGWSIMFNGEIFNYLEIREELQSLGWSFYGGSDTEVLLKAWIQWGLAALPRLNGMFAFATFNRVSGELWLIRDRYGVKPLLWARTAEGGLVFSSSVAAVAVETDADVDVDYCARGLRYNTFELPESGAPFRQVLAVPPGCWMKAQISDSAILIADGRWYNLGDAVSKRVAAIASNTDEQLLEECRQLMDSAVRLRLRSDVPLAVSLSGGLDSSTVAALASRHVSGLKGFNYGSPDSNASEGPSVAAFARNVGISAEFIWPKHDAIGLDALLDGTLAAQEAPFGGLSVLAQNAVFRTVHQSGFKVLLGGQGGDESFAGYRKFFVVAMRNALNRRDPRDAVRYVWSLGLMLMHEAKQARMYWQNLSRYNNRRPAEFQLIAWQSPYVNLWGSRGTTLRARQIEDVERWSLPTLLRYEDRNSMWHGLESRLPFMDYRLVELALALPARLKIAKGFGKWALRKIGKDIVPDFIRLNRRKRGFDVTQSWVEGGIGASLRRRILEHHSTLAPHLKRPLDVESMLSNSNLVRYPKLLDEALMLGWLTKPVRRLEPFRGAA